MTLDDLTAAVLLPDQPMTSSPEHPRMAYSPVVAAGGLMLGAWSLRAAAWTDRHVHVEINTVLEGELQVTVDGQTTVVGAGRSIAVPPNSLARYAAPSFARMAVVYGPNPTGAPATDVGYEEL